MAFMGQTRVTMEQFLAMTPAERKVMPLQQSSALWSEVMARDLKEFNRRRRVGEAPPPVTL
jgi:hypothetical protein